MVLWAGCWYAYEAAAAVTTALVYRAIQLLFAALPPSETSKCPQTTAYILAALFVVQTAYQVALWSKTEVRAMVLFE